MPTYLQAETATHFPDNISDGFAKPMYGWSAFRPLHLEGVGGSSMTSNVWYGEPRQMLEFAEQLAEYYEGIKDETECDEMDGISVGYWEKDGLAMIGEFCTGDAFFEQKSDELYEKSLRLTLLLGDGNDNEAGMILNNHAEEDLDVQTRLTLAHFMNHHVLWVLNDSEDLLEGFSEEDKEQLRAILLQDGSSQIYAITPLEANPGKYPQKARVSPATNLPGPIVTSDVLTPWAAIHFPQDICDGFVTPKAAWCSTEPKGMLEDVGGSCMFSSVWVGSPQDVMRFAETLTQFHQQFMASPAQWKTEPPHPEREGVAVAYWQHDGVAMCGEFFTWHGLAMTERNEQIDALSKSLTQVLFEGNDNSAAALLINQDADLDVLTRLKLAACMNREPTQFVLEMFDENPEYIPGFTKADRDALDLALR